MSYAVELEDEAAATILALPDSALQRHIIAELDRLASNPTRLSKRHPRGYGQQFEFEYHHAGVHLAITVTFRYGASEQSLHVSDVYVEYT